MAISLGAIRRGFSVYFGSLPDLLDRLAQAENRMCKKMAHLRKCRLLVLDEIGHRGLDKQATTCLFQLISERYERRSMILTSNKSSANGAAIFQDNVIASAIPDRLLHHSHTINIKGESYRLKDKRKAGVWTQPGRRAGHRDQFVRIDLHLIFAREAPKAAGIANSLRQSNSASRKEGLQRSRMRSGLTKHDVSRCGPRDGVQPPPKSNQRYPGGRARGAFNNSRIGSGLLMHSFVRCI